MDINTTIATSDALSLFDYWEGIPIDDIVPLKLNQKIEQSINGFEELLSEIGKADKDPSQQYLSFVWSISLRDFTILLRDSLLAAVKYEQFIEDNKKVDETYSRELLIIIQKATNELIQDYLHSKIVTVEEKVWQHQESPIGEIIDQLEEIQKQSKKIYRSSAKIDTLRSNIGEYVKDFELQYSRQSNAVKQLFSIVEEVKTNIQDVSADSDEITINNVVDQIGESSQKLELVQGIESIDILPYANNETLSIPVSTKNGNIIFKSINIKSEFARWFSSYIYPKIIELESKRDHAVEKCLYAFSQIRTKIAAISLAEIDDSIDLQKEFEFIFLQLDKEVLEALKNEEKETNSLVDHHQDNYLLASNIYSDDVLFLPESGSSQISNLSKDAQKRLISNFEKYRKELKTYINKVLSRYVEIDKTPYGQFVKNQTSIYDVDDSLALFLKSGYLGKSFTVPRPEIINPIVEEYKLWLDGFAGAMLLSGLSGSGKSTVLGMLNHIGLNEEIIQLNVGESYFIQHRSYDPIYNLKELIDQVLNRTRGRRIIICIDDLEHWHNDENELYDNITKLFQSIIKHRNRVFFILTCSPFFKQRIQQFKDLKSFFTRQSNMEKMNSIQIRNALNLRARVNDLANVENKDLDSRFGNIIRESKGNIGFAMMEYCRYHNENYKSNVKSQEFTELIRSYSTLLKYISSYRLCSIKTLSNSLSEMDFIDTMKSIDFLVGQKILTRQKKGKVYINPLLVHTIEKTLFKQ